MAGIRRRWPWEATANALESLAFGCKDALFLWFDDYTLDGTLLERQRRQQAAARLFRGVANRTGRERMRADTRLRPARIPRGLPRARRKSSSTGSRSTRASSTSRSATATFRSALALDEAQQRAREGVYASAMAAFVRWLAPRLLEVRGRLAARTGDLRRGIDAGHDRAASNLAELVATWELVLEFALEVGALEPSSPLLERGTAAILSLADEQRRRQEEADPVRRFLGVIDSAVTSGRAHLAAKDGGVPADSTRWGWRQGWASGDRIGWVSGEDVWLDPSSAYKIAVAAAGAEQPGRAPCPARSGADARAGAAVCRTTRTAPPSGYGTCRARSGALFT